MNILEIIPLLASDEESNPVWNIIPLLAAFVGAWGGAIWTLSRFKKEKAFEKRLDWYSRMIICLQETAIDLACAKSFSLDYLDNNPGYATISNDIWIKVQLRHLDVNKLTGEGVIYARQRSYKILWDNTGVLQKLANETDAFSKVTKLHLDKVRPTIDKLREASNILAEDMRKQLDLDPLGVHPRDQEQ